jgi:hypothetical protein
MSWEGESTMKKIEVLVIFANPRGTSQLRLGTEDRVIRESIRLSSNRSKISLTTCNAATIHDLRRAFLDKQFDIVHISGHGTGAGLVLENEAGERYVVPQKALADQLRAYSPPLQCAILNACYSISQGHLTSLELPFTIAMEGPISDDAAIEFSRGFYDAIGAGRGIDFAYEEGCRTVNLAAPNTHFISKILKKGEQSTGDGTRDAGSSWTEPGRTTHYNSVKAIVGLAIDVSGSMSEKIRNDTGGSMTRLEGFRHSLGKLATDARNRVKESRARNIVTNIDVFAYAFGLRAMNYCDMLSLMSLSGHVISRQEIEELKNRYIREMQDRYRGYEGLGGLAAQFGLGGLARSFESSIRANAESEIRRKVMLEVGRRLEKQLNAVGETTLPIEDIAGLWEDSSQALENAEELIFGNTPMRGALTEVEGRLRREQSKQDKGKLSTLFILSDGDPTDGDPTDIAKSIKASGTVIISCFVTDQDIANPRVLFGASEERWSNGAKLMFTMASELDDDSSIAKFLLRKGWVIQPKAKLFVQINHSSVMNEFMETILCPFEATSEGLPRGV